MSAFARDPALAALPIPVVFLVVRGVERRIAPAAVEAACRAEAVRLLATSSYEALAATPALAAYRALHAALGKTGRQFLPAPERVFRQLFKHGCWRVTEPLVDAYTLVSLRTRVSIGAHDLACLELPVRLACTEGGEPFLPIGETKPLRLSRGEYGYRDARGLVIGRMECRQAEATKVTGRTRDVLFILQGNGAVGAAALREAAGALLAALQDFVGSIESSELTVLI